MNEYAQNLCQRLVKEDAEVEFRIKTGTEMYRKGFGRIELQYADGSPVENASLKFKQISHEYLFGCNAFMFNQFPEEECPQRSSALQRGLFLLFPAASFRPARLFPDTRKRIFRSPAYLLPRSALFLQRNK